MQKLDWSHFYNTVDGKLESTSQTRHGIDPATGEAGPDVPVSVTKDVDRATAAAQKAFTSWAGVPWAERKKAILAFADALEQESEAFVQHLTKEQGKPVRALDALISTY